MMLKCIVLHTCLLKQTTIPVYFTNCYKMLKSMAFFYKCLLNYHTCLFQKLFYKVEMSGFAPYIYWMLKFLDVDISVFAKMSIGYSTVSLH